MSHESLMRITILLNGYAMTNIVKRANGAANCTQKESMEAF